MSQQQKRYYRSKIPPLDIPGKANKILNLLLLALIFILMRIWFLSVIQYDQKMEESKKPQRKVVMEPAKRGTIRDRFNAPLAINKIQYQAGIVYSDLLSVPAVIWKKDKQGKLIKHFRRKEYITAISKQLGKELNMDYLRIVDLIYSKASLYHNIPFIIKEEISEQSYYRLKMMEKDWPGIHVQRVPKRYYPKNQVGADIIGFMGAINKEEYEKIMAEIHTLQEYLKDSDSDKLVDLPGGISNYDEATYRLKELEANAYTINDDVGKMGIEGFFEDHLRGYQGKKIFYSDSRGNFLREIPGGKNPLSGQRILLTISAELQEFAEELLTKNERIRTPHFSNKARQTLLSIKEPWIKGGAIIAIDPNNGEVLSLASYPRFNPNDFLASAKKRTNIHRWFETENYIAEIWDQKRNLERERFDDKKQTFFEEEIRLDLKNYLDLILPPTNEAYQALMNMNSLKKIIDIQNEFERLLHLSGQTNAYFALNALYNTPPHNVYKNATSEEIKARIKAEFQTHADELKEIKQKMDPIFGLIKNNYDKILLLDLCKVLVPNHLFDEALLNEIKETTLSSYRNISTAKGAIVPIVREMAKTLFHEMQFLPWRALNEKAFLKEKRIQEKLLKKYQKPYIDYFDAKENEMFHAFWKKNHLTFLMTFLTGSQTLEDEELKPYIEHFNLKNSSFSWDSTSLLLKDALKGLKKETAIRYLSTLRSFNDLNRPLFGSYRYLRKNSNKEQLEKHLAAAFYPKTGFGYARSHGFRQSTIQGSIFKLVTAYETLVQQYKKLDCLNLSFKDLNPLNIVDVTHRYGKDLSLGFFQDGTPIPRMYKGGRLLKSLSSGIGQIDLIKAIETSSNPYFSILAGDFLSSPDDLSQSAKNFSFGSKTGIDLTAELAGSVPNDLNHNRSGLYAMAIGQHSLVVTPLQTAIFLSSIANGGKILKPNIVKMRVANDLETNQNIIITTQPKIQNTLFMPDIIRGSLLEGMRLVVQKQIRNNLFELTKFYQDYPDTIKDYISMKDQFIGKTSTAEATENINLDLERGTNLCSHTWFGAIAFHSDFLGLSKDALIFQDSNNKPEIVVVVYLKYGSYGKEAAPIAAQMIKKWHEIKAKNLK